MKKELRKKDKDRIFHSAMAAFIIFLLSELSIRSYNLYKTFPFVDVPSHFFAGIAIGLGVYWTMAERNWKHPGWLTVLFTIGIAGVWEILETMEDLIVENPPYLQDIFWWDGFWDMVVTTIGGLVALFIVMKIKKLRARQLPKKLKPND